MLLVAAHCQKTFYLCVLMLSFGVVKILGAEQSLQDHCTLSHVCLCMFSEAGGSLFVAELGSTC